LSGQAQRVRAECPVPGEMLDRRLLAYSVEKLYF